eukprot:6300603-Pyramimonas_sp.AAC.1
MSDGGRRVPRPLALARTGRTLRCCLQARGHLHAFPGRRLCAPGAAADPAVRLPQKMNVHLVIIIIVHCF